MAMRKEMKHEGIEQTNEKEPIMKKSKEETKGKEKEFERTLIREDQP